MGIYSKMLHINGSSLLHRNSKRLLKAVWMIHWPFHLNKQFQMIQCMIWLRLLVIFVFSQHFKTGITSRMEKLVELVWSSWISYCWWKSLECCLYNSFCQVGCPQQKKYYRPSFRLHVHFHPSIWLMYNYRPNHLRAIICLFELLWKLSMTFPWIMLCNSRILQLPFECFCVPRSRQDIAAPGSGRKQRFDR